MAKFRVIVQSVDTAAGRGPGAVTAVIDDAKDVGASEQVNGGGEFFMTLPMSHRQIEQVVPLETHYKVQRMKNAVEYETIFAGLVDDYEATRDEVVFYGRDYLSLLDTVVTGSVKYTSKYIGQIVTPILTSARAVPDSRVNFITMGTIQNTATTTTALSAYQSQLEFIQQLSDIAMSDTNVRTILQVKPRSSDTPKFVYTANQGTDKENIRLEYGGVVNDFFYAPGYGTFRSVVRAIGQKREGATVLYSTQTSALAPTSQYGYISEPMLFIDIVDQGALDDKAKRALRAFSRVGKTVGLGIRQGALAPWDGYDLGDSLRVVIDRGIVNLNALYTLWGLEWIGRKNGSEELVLSLLPKDV